MENEIKVFDKNTLVVKDYLAFHYFNKNIDYISEYLRFPLTDGSVYKVRVGSCISSNHCNVYVIEQVRNGNVKRVELESDGHQRNVLQEVGYAAEQLKGYKLKESENLFTMKIDIDERDVVNDDEFPQFLRYYIMFDNVEFQETVINKPSVQNLFMPEFQKTAADTYTKGVGLDMDIVVEGKIIKASKFMLSTYSNVLKAMFEHNWIETRENRLEIRSSNDKNSKMEYSIVSAFIKALHGVELEFGTVLNAVKIIEICRMYAVPQLECQAFKYFNANINDDNIIEVLLYTHRFAVEDVKNMAIEFILSDQYNMFEDLVANKNEIPEDLFHELLIKMRKELVNK